MKCGQWGRRMKNVVQKQASLIQHGRTITPITFYWIKKSRMVAFLLHEHGRIAFHGSYNQPQERRINLSVEVNDHSGQFCFTRCHLIWAFCRQKHLSPPWTDNRMKLYKLKKNSKWGIQSSKTLMFNSFQKQFGWKGWMCVLGFNTAALYFISKFYLEE